MNTTNDTRNMQQRQQQHDNNNTDSNMKMGADDSETMVPLTPSRLGQEGVQTNEGQITDVTIGDTKKKEKKKRKSPLTPWKKPPGT